MTKEAKRCVTGFNVEWISLIDSPANQKKIILKSANAKPDDADRKEWNFPIAKSDTEKRIVYGLVAVPGEIDTDGDVYTLAVEKRGISAFISRSLNQLNFTLLGFLFTQNYTSSQTV